MASKIQHVAFIMDGNRRWATERGLPKMEGHTKGLKNFKNIVEYCSDLKIPYVSFWALSTENLKKRSAKEIKHLFNLLSEIRDYLKDFIEHDARVEYIGDLSKLPGWLRVILNDVQRKTKDHQRMVITLAINYGGHDEIIRMAKEVAKSMNKASQITESNLNKIIDTGFLPPVDLLIRTGGYKRLSGFMPWRIDYAELYFTAQKWPAFSKKDLDKALDWYQQQKRNFGQ